MTETVFCRKFKQDLPKMKIPPMPGSKGLDLMSTISQQAWDEWKSKQTMLINEKHLDLSSIDDRSYLEEQMEKFFNNDQTDEPTGFKPLA
ncbi:MAG: oxidative damage protection protein [Gammaproteobacteria bacterium]|jgi:Fe-S cluster biosynthesis and repair protein YggX